jgi:extracellular factor (EF) 3-hydroxypalmitic acid methyl ester biosynthesis protein
MKASEATVASAPIEGRAILDRAYDAFSSEGRVFEEMDHLVGALADLRQRTSADDWNAFCRVECVGHPVRFLVHQDPLTERAFFKPRGYPGDAVLLDMFYGEDGVKPYVDEATPLGQEIYRYTSAGMAATALRRRKEVLASMIDRVSDSHAEPHIMTIGCGHLREAGLSQALQERRIERFLAVDRDADCLRVVREKWGPYGVDTAESTVNELIAATPDLGTFNLVYAAGPYDLLPRPAAIRLTDALFEATQPGGLLLVTNFLEGIKDVGYMDAFMDWRIHHRDAAEMFSLTSGLPEEEIADRRTFAEESGGIVFLAVRRR